MCKELNMDIEEAIAKLEGRVIMRGEHSNDDIYRIARFHAKGG